jgi:hypothetical protein
MPPGTHSWSRTNRTDNPAAPVRVCPPLSASGAPGHQLGTPPLSSAPGGRRLPRASGRPADRADKGGSAVTKRGWERLRARSSSSSAASRPRSGPPPPGPSFARPASTAGRGRACDRAGARRWRSGRNLGAELDADLTVDSRPSLGALSLLFNPSRCLEKAAAVRQAPGPWFRTTSRVDQRVLCGVSDARRERPR